MNVEKLDKSEQRYQELEDLLGDPDVISNSKQYQTFAKEMAELSEIVSAYRKYKDVVSQQEGLKKDLQQKQDKEFEELIHSELKDLEEKQHTLQKQIADLLSPKFQEKDRDIIMEIRAGTGGAEAALFAGDLYRMYTKYATNRGWKVESISISPAEAGGVKEAIFSVSGKGVSRLLKWESGAHRVQRVPTTEASGRIHTSAATVVVLFEAQEIDLTIDPKDLRIDIFRSSGPGGQSVNTTDSAVRLTHLPTGVVVICQDERSQLKNKIKAMRVLRARLLDRMEQEKAQKESQERKSKVGSGDRSEKIRTYNFPDRRVTDHRIGFTSHQLLSILDGELDELTTALSESAENQAQE